MGIRRFVCGLLFASMMTGVALAQSPVAKFIFEDAEEAFAKQDYKTALEKLDEAEKEFGKINPPILYLRIMARNELLKANPADFDTVERLRKETALYLKEYGEMESVQDKAREVYNVSAEIKQYPATRSEYEAWLKEAGELYNQGWLYYKGQGVTKDYAIAREMWEKAAQRGHANAINNLGILYKLGQGVTQDYAKAREWYEKGAEKGHADAMFNLGLLYNNGEGVTQNYATARGWYEKAAEKGNASAMFNIGLLYAKGQGVTKDDTIARAWVEKAAEKGDAVAMIALGLLYRNGEGVAQNYATARDWFEKAASKGHARAMKNLADLYETGGYGLERDKKMAKEWRAKADAAGKE